LNHQHLLYLLKLNTYLSFKEFFFVVLKRIDIDMLAIDIHSSLEGTGIKNTPNSTKNILVSTMRGRVYFNLMVTTRKMTINCAIVKKIKILEE